MTPAGAADVLVAGGAPLRNPWAVAVAPDGAMLVADEGAEAMFSIAPAGAVDTVVSGRELDDPVGIALAPAGGAYVSDRNRDAVLRLELANGRVTKVADVRDAAGLAIDRAGKLLVTDGARSAASTRAPARSRPPRRARRSTDPQDVAVALDGTMYVIDGARVLRISPTGREEPCSPRARRSTTRARSTSSPTATSWWPTARARVIHVDRDTGAKSLVTGGSVLRRPTGIASVGGAGVDPSGGGNGDPTGPAAPPPPPPPADPGGGGTTPARGGGGTGGGTPVPGPGGTTVVRNPAARSP